MIARSKTFKTAAAFVLLVVGAGVLLFHPSRPLYMKHTPVEFAAPDGVLLRGTLSWPRWSRPPLPGIVLVHGSGRLGREHVIGDVRHLVWRGFAVLAYDKRGVGESAGTYEQRGGDGAEGTLRRLAGDAARAFDALANSPGVDATRLGFFGASQAGWVIPLAAELVSTPPGFHVILSGPAVSTGAEQFYSDLTGDGLRPPQVADRTEVERLTLAFNGRPGFHPLPFLHATRVPTLWLLGARDLSVPTFASVRALDTIREKGNTSHTVIQYATADHSLRDTDTGRPVPLWDDMMRWLGERGIMAARPGFRSRSLTSATRSGPS